MRHAVFAAFATLACGSGSQNVSDGGADINSDVIADVSDAPFVMASHAAFPPMPSNGGRVLSPASIVVVTFAAYPLADDVEAMADWIATSQWYAAVGVEYAAAPSVIAKTRLSETPPAFASSAAFSAYVQSKIGTDIEGPPNTSVLYAFVLPVGATFTDPQIGTLCDTFTGYHDTASTYAFAVVGSCPKHVAGLTDVEQVERVFSHEIIEAITDPFGDGIAARSPDDPWSFIGGGEVADVCNGFWREGGFLAVRSWSNASAAANTDPCQPVVAGVPFFAVALDDPKTKHVTAGANITLALTGWSNAPTSDWTVQAVAQPTPFLTQTELTTSAFQNGASSSITIMIPADAPTNTTGVVLLHARHAGDATYNATPIALHVD